MKIFKVIERKILFLRIINKVFFRMFDCRFTVERGERKGKIIVACEKSEESIPQRISSPRDNLEHRHFQRFNTFMARQERYQHRPPSFFPYSPRPGSFTFAFLNLIKFHGFSRLRDRRGARETLQNQFRLGIMNFVNYAPRIGGSQPALRRGRGVLIWQVGCQR